MTQAWNLSQLANKVNSSGQLDASTGLVNATPVANGGTNNATLPVTAGGVIYTDGSKLVNVGAGTTGQILTSQGASSPIWALNAGYGGFSTVIFASSGTFTLPTGITQARITVTGGGGGGRGAVTAAVGGDGGVAIAYCTGISGTLTITVGSGGSSGVSGGTSSIVGTGVSVSATGGGGATSGVNGTMGVGTVSTGTALFAGLFAKGRNLITSYTEISGATSGTGVVWSATSGFSAGKGGSANTGGINGACSGTVMIEY